MNTSIFKKIAINEYYKMTKDERRDLIRGQLYINFSRIKKLYVILFILNLILLLVDIFSFRKYWGQMMGYRYLFYLHIIILVSLAIFIFLTTCCSKKDYGDRYPRCKWLLCYGSTIYILLWSVVLTVNAQFIHGHISAYIIGIFSLSSIYILSPFYSSIILLIAHSFFIVLIINFGVSSYDLSGHIINSTFLIILALGISHMNFISYINDYKANKIINSMNKELTKARIGLEQTVKIKTDELHKANQKLIGEIHKRHQIQIKALKNKLEYEKEKELLNEKIKYEELKTEFFTNISHELKTPLNVIFSAQQMMNLYLQSFENEDDKMRFKKYNDLVKQNSYRLIRLIENLIDITKIDVGNYNLSLSNNDIVKIVQEIAFSVTEYVENKDISLVFDSELDKRIIACDPDKIERILLNLLSNAVKFTSENGYIYISIYKENSQICISIKDTGIGIPYEMQASIFERFIQVDRSIRREREGSGIGLSLVKSLVEMHEGNIELISTPGDGSEFIIKLPDKMVEINNNSNSLIAEYVEDKVEKINVEFSDIYF